MTGQELKAWRLRHGYTQLGAATFTGVSRRTWIRYENGTSQVPRWLRLIVAAY